MLLRTLSMSTDGFSPFDGVSSTTWPIILFNLNLPPEMRVHVEEVLCAGLLPGDLQDLLFTSFPIPHTSRKNRLRPILFPLRSHDSFISQSRSIVTAPSRVWYKGASIFYKLPAIESTLSFPTDFMHLIFENVLQTLVSLFGGDVKGMEQDVFVIPKKKWEDLGRATAACGASIPSCFGSRPPNFVENRQRCTADSWSFWLLYHASNLLDGCLPSAHYRHFARFSELVGECLQFEMPKERLPGLRRDFAEWVQDFEK